MKVLLLTTHLDIGGLGVYTLSLAQALRSAGLDVFVASSGGALLADLEKSGIQHIHIPVRTSSDIGIHTIASFFKISSIVRRHGIGILHAQTRVTQIISHMVSKRTGAVFISTCHGFFKMKLFRHIYPCWGEHIIAISDAVRQHLIRDLKVSKDSISIVYNGVDAQRFKPNASAADKQLIKKQYSLGKGPVIGIISRLSEVKGHKYLLKAFALVLKRLPDAQLLIIGDGPKKYGDKLKLQAGQLGITSNVYFHPGCKDTVIPLSVIDVFCHPSLQEGLGLSILEAMSMEIPVVASGVGGIYTLIKHEANGLLVSPMDEQALSESIIKIMSNPDMARSMGKASREKILQNFTIDIMRDKVIGVYETVSHPSCFALRSKTAGVEKRSHRNKKIL
jgi:glycosyltransferase involved in cell wall biosynthesis